MPRRYLLLIFFIFFSFYIYAQNTPTFRQKIITLTQKSQLLDTLSIVPESVIAHHFFTHQPVLILLKNDSISLKMKNIDSIKAVVQYRVLPFLFKKKYALYDSLSIKSAGENILLSTEKKSENTLDAPPLLQYNGAYTRGISAGNAQNLTLQSDFNLQLAGKISEDIEINAALSDNSYPLQADGNTLKLDEFDKVFIQLKRKNALLTAGDYELGQKNGYFLNFYKKLRGATFFQPDISIGKGKLETRASVAMSRGKFARQTLAVEEGNQGAYRLQGNNGERFLIVLAGTEKIYADGRLLRRGETEDYTIDYNRADVTFTDKLLVRKELRIIIEFEYADQNYARSLYAANTTYSFGQKSKIYFNILSEQDSKISGGQQSLSLIEKRLLANAGDRVGTAFFSGIDTLVAFDQTKIMYEQRDTVLNNIVFKILSYSTNPNTARLVVKFSEVGAGNGNYSLKNSAANGRVYEWIAPNVTGNKRGSYEPTLQLIAPKQQQIYTAGTQLQVTKNTLIDAEIAMSNNNVNLFSILDKDNDVGMASYIRIHKKYNIFSTWEGNIGASYEYMKANFKAFNPYRSAEFSRDWNIQNIDNQLSDENLFAVNANVAKEKIGNIQYELSGFFQKNNYSGLRHNALIELEKNNWYIRTNVNFLQSENNIEKTNFLRPKWEIGRQINEKKDWKIGIFGEYEKNKKYDFVTNDLRLNSFAFDAIGVRFANATENKWHFNTEIRQRRDFLPDKNVFSKTSTAQEILCSGHGEQSKNARLEWNFTYRNLQYTAFSSTQTNQNTYLGKIFHTFNGLKNTIRATHTYEIGSGQEPKVEFTYLKVRAGEGVYAWYDRNNDNVSQQDEFDISPFRDQAEYVRIAVFTNRYVRSNNVDFNQNIAIEPKLYWQKTLYNQKSIWQNATERLSLQHGWHIQRKVRAANNVQVWNPFQLSIIDTSLVSIHSTMRSTLFFNRNNAVFENSFGFSDARNRFIATQGFEQRITTEYFTAFRWQILAAARLEIRATQTQNSNASQFFASRDYFFKGYRIEPQLVLQPNNTFRFSTIYKFIYQKNTLQNVLSQATQHSFSGEITYHFTKNSQSEPFPTMIRAQITYTSMQFEGIANTPVGFALLQGLQNGNNFLWNISLDRPIQKNMQLSIGYEGRKTGESRIIHVGRAQIRAILN